jgi:HSP20 family protein
MAGTLTHWEPFAEIAELRSRFDRMLGELGNGHEREWTPAIDVRRDGDRLVVRADVPGIKPEEITIQFADDTLTLSGEHTEHKEEKEGDYVRRERRYGAFSRVLPLPQGVDAKKIKARTQDGVLQVEIPLPKEAANEPITITPTAGS